MIPIQNGKPYTFQERGYVGLLALPPSGGLKQGWVAGIPIPPSRGIRINLTRLVMPGQTILVHFSGDGPAAAEFTPAESPVK